MKFNYFNIIVLRVLLVEICTPSSTNIIEDFFYETKQLKKLN